MLTFMNPTPDSHQKRSLPRRRCGRGGNALAHGKVDLPRRCEFFGDLEAGVAPSHDEHLAVGKLRRVAIVGAMDLEDRLVQITSDGGHEGDLERAGRDDDLVRREFLVRGRHQSTSLHASVRDVTFALSFTGRSKADTYDWR